MIGQFKNLKRMVRCDYCTETFVNAYKRLRYNKKTIYFPERQICTRAYPRGSKGRGLAG